MESALGGATLAAFVLGSVFALFQFVSGVRGLELMLSIAVSYGFILAVSWLVMALLVRRGR